VGWILWIGLFVGQVSFASIDRRLGRATASCWERRLVVNVVVQIFFNLWATAAARLLNTMVVAIVVATVPEMLVFLS
jgi:hypothetical protein